MVMPTGSGNSGGGGQGLKPGWQGMRDGGSWSTPVSDFVGNMADWRVEPGQFGNQVIMSFDRCQVFQSDSPYPGAEVEVWIKYSEQKNSGWGKLGQSMADKLGVELELMDIDQLKGQQMHMVRHDNVPFGFNDRVTGAPATGTVWELTELLAPGQQATPTVPAVPTIPPVPQPMSPMAPAVAAPHVPVVPPADGAAEAKALELLDGKNLSEYFQIVLTDPVVKTNSELVTQIVNNTFAQAKVTTGEVTLDDQGVYHKA
jgi:hypothetical protein